MTDQMKGIVLGALAIALVAGEAAAGQSTAATDFSGAYQVDCRSTSLTLGVQLVELNGTTVATPEQRTVALTLPCAGDEQALADLHRRCVQAFEPDAVCDHALALTRRAIAELTERQSGTLELEVADAGTWWNRVAGLYNMAGELVTLAGDSVGASFILANNDGASHGAFASVKLSAAPVPWFGAVCATTLASAVTGRIDRGDGFALTARHSADLSMWCPTTGADGIRRTARIGLSLRTELEGGPVVLRHWAVE
jgi:hypothetical protein